ncbi:lantibiotic dehydratase [Flavobacterium sp.]|uniref:lantibiotic dehydratase n=1 Tax=Flavobacterium sp. TaxID=239 RepID=UPI0037521A80
MKNYSFTKTAIVRTPLGEKQIDLSWEKILEIFSKKENREALFIGSPNIYNALVLWEKGEAFQAEDELKNLKGSLYKYASRLSNRSTPFGMFSTVSAVDVTPETSLNIQESILGRYTKYDMYFLGSLLPILTKEDSIRSVLKYRSNNSLYTVFDKYRYVEYYFKENVRFHKISEVEITEYLDLILEKSKNGILIKDLIPILISEDITEQDSLEFINTLIESQFIVSELEFTITGEDYFEKVLKIFSEERFDFYEGQVVKKLLTNLKNKINDLDQNIINDPSLYSEIHKLLDEEINNVDISKLFQVDSFRKIENGTIGFKTLKTLRPAISVLNKLQSSYENQNLKEFKRKFQERYEEYEQPLVKVLDPDIGIGYGKKSGAKAPLVDELAINPNYSKERQVLFDDKKTFLLKKLIQSTKDGSATVELTDDEINKFEENEAIYPDTFSAFLNIFNENGKEKIHLKSISGPSANGLIGRFTHLDSKILDLSNEISSLENQLHPDKIIAEIVHLPQARTGNILYRNFQRDYEIPYLGNASVDQEHQIAIDDLYISINKMNRVVIFSKRLNKEVIPRLSNAHNFSSNALPIYNFLCDIQNQEATGFGFSWGTLQYDFDFLPRVSYKEVVLSKATWNINKIAIDAILANDESKAVEVVRGFQQERNIPDVIYFTQGDNEVVINFKNDLSCLVFYFMLKGEKMIQLKEFLFDDDSITNNYCNEIIFSAHRNIEVKKEAVTAGYVPEENKNNVISSFSIGEKWLYYKFYCGERAGEELLNRAINPIVEELQSKKIIDKWFFIRYQDASGPHLRFRVLLKNTDFFTESIQIIKKHIKPFEDTQIIWKTQTDNYLRELQRYGFEAIEDTETLFYNDSQCTLEFADMIEGDSGEKVRWLFSLLSMDHLLNDFGFSLNEKIEILKVAKISFGKEFNRNGNLNKQINEMFAQNEYEIECFLNEEKIEEMYHPIWDVIRNRSYKNKEAAQNIRQLFVEKKLPTSLHNVAISYLHMICNRVFLSKQRVHEMVVYDYLYKYYNKQLHVGKQTNKEVELAN